MKDNPLAAERRIVFIQFGDYAEAAHRLAAGGPEDYYAQRYTVDYVAAFAAHRGDAAVIALTRDYSETRLSSGVIAEGLLYYPPNARPQLRRLLEMLERRQPTDLILSSPILGVMRWARRNRIRTLPLFMDSFLAPRRRLKNWRLVRLLNDDFFPWVANHSIAAARDLVRIGVRPGKVLPFDWPPVVSPSDFPASKEPPLGKPFKLLYVGQLIESKGAGDAIAALAVLPDCTLTLIGAGSDEVDLRKLGESFATLNRISFLGKRPHPEVLAAMRAHDALLVPSRHEYPEGLPMTLYEAMCTCPPVLASDHPMFRQRLVHLHNALIFPAGDALALAAEVKRLMASPALYRELSLAAGAAAANYLCPLKWHHLLDAWLEQSPQATQFLTGFALANGA